MKSALLLICFICLNISLFSQIEARRSKPRVMRGYFLVEGLETYSKSLWGDQSHLTVYNRSKIYFLPVAKRDLPLTERWCSVSELLVIKPQIRVMDSLDLVQWGMAEDWNIDVLVRQNLDFLQKLTLLSELKEPSQQYHPDLLLMKGRIRATPQLKNLLPTAFSDCTGKMVKADFQVVPLIAATSSRLKVVRVVAPQ
jgi:hypothetical protein